MTDAAIAAMASAKGLPAAAPAAAVGVRLACSSAWSAATRSSEYDRLRRAPARAPVPGIALSTDIIVGFPGETEDDFATTVRLPAPGALRPRLLVQVLAARGNPRGALAETVIARRSAGGCKPSSRFRNGSRLERSRAWCGRAVEVLVEGPAKRGQGWLSGKSAQFKTTVFPSTRHAPGDLVSVGVRDATAHTLIGEVADGPRLEPSANA